MEKITDSFYLEAAIAICSNLEVPRALEASFDLLRTKLPLDALYMQVYVEELGSLRIIARAVAEGGVPMDLLLPLTGPGKEEIEAGYQKLNLSGTQRRFFIQNDIEENQATMEILRKLDEPVSSILGMLLEVDDKPLGVIICRAVGKNRYTDEHIEILKPLMQPFYISLSNALAHREVLKLREILLDDNRYLQGELEKSVGDQIIGTHFGLKGVMNMVRQVAPTDSPVLLLGETGTGKDMIASAVHHSSGRNKGPFISVNCGAIPESLIDSELFGHEKGAFTGALAQKRGRFERANGGTIFLDEIGELPPAAQVRLLRVLQNREIERVGGTESIILDIRVIAATNRDLEEMVREKLFREDLWFRLNVFPILLPPLRDRRSDIPALVQHFIQRKARELKLPSVPALAPGAIEDLLGYGWPGNVRELENIIERACIIYRDMPLRFDELISGSPKRSSRGRDAESLELDDAVSRHIKMVLDRTEGKIHGTGGAAELLGINPSTLRNRMDKLGIEYKRS